jgi:hypothetical protein
MPLPILFAIIGAVTGLFVSQLAINLDDKNITLFLFSQVILVAVFAFIWKKQNTANIVKAMLVMGGLLFGLSYWFVSQGYNEGSRYSPLFILALIQISIIITAFIQSWRPKKPHFIYSDLFENAWNNHFYLIFSAFLTIGFLLVLGLGTQLFESIGFKISKIIWSKEITPVIVGTLIGTGIGISREYSNLIFKIRGVFFAIFQVMAYLAAAIVIFFTISLPFSLETLFDNRNTSMILLSVVALSILLLNTLVDSVTADDDAEPIIEGALTATEKQSPLPIWKNRIFSLQIILLPLLSLLSVYAISLRIMQYGFMPRRIIAIIVALSLSLYSLAYAYQLFKRKSQWTQGLASVNPPLAIFWVAILIALSSPLLDPMRLSVNNQVQRLQSNKVSVDEFDFKALKYRLGKRGKEALEKVLRWNQHPEYAAIKNNIEKLPERRKDREKFIQVIGEAPPEVASLKSNFNQWRCNDSSPCYIKQLDIIGSDNRENNDKKVMLFFFDEGSFSAELYEYKKQWKLLTVYGSRRLNRPPFTPFDKGQQKITSTQMKQIIEVLRKNKEKLIKPKYMDLDIGGIKLRQ